MGIEPTRTAPPELENKRFGTMANPKCDGRVNFRDTRGRVGIREQTAVTFGVLGGIAGRSYDLHVNQTAFDNRRYAGLRRRQQPATLGQ
jgi:hypothetical protein